MSTDVAERLREITYHGIPLSSIVDEALAAERKATVERIRAALEAMRGAPAHESKLLERWRVLAILDGIAE